jgi:hypothetical protein
MQSAPDMEERGPGELSDSRDALDDLPELRARLERDGYLFLRGLLPRRVLEPLRDELAGVLARAGLVRPGGDRLEPVPGKSCADGDPDYLAVYGRLFTCERFHAIGHCAELRGFFDALLDGPTFPHPRPIARIVFPGDERNTTPQHQDFFYTQGTARAYTAWITLVPCSRSLGGLEIARGSHRIGFRDVRPASVFGGVEVDADFPESAWLGADYEVGDVLVFSALTVHRAAPNRSDRVRLSVDVRTQRTSEPVCWTTLDVRAAGTTWPRVYAGWASREHQYYWRTLPLTVVDVDPGPANRRDARALELAARGEARARACLERIAIRHPDPSLRARAESLMHALDGRSP